VLVKEVRNPDARRRDMALATLEHIASPEAVRSALNSVLAEENPEIQQWATARLQKITPRP
jgi:hypothetical protein